jgi:phage regulator Rha-like protein
VRPGKWLDDHMRGLNLTAAIVTVQNGKPITNSRDVADLFGRLHKNVLQGIQNLECSENFVG